MNQWHYNKIKQLKDWERDLRAVLAFKNDMDEETRKDIVRYISLLDYAIKQAERVQELENVNRVLKKSNEGSERAKERLRNWIDEFEIENERYREALEAIAYFEDKEEGEVATRIDVKYIARKALEGDSDE